MNNVGGPPRSATHPPTHPKELTLPPNPANHQGLVPKPPPPRRGICNFPKIGGKPDKATHPHPQTLPPLVKYQPATQQLPPPSLEPPPQCHDAPPTRGGGGRELHHIMVALKLQQPQYNLKKNFLQHLVFPLLFGPSDDPGGGGIAVGGGGGKVTSNKSGKDRRCKLACELHTAKTHCQSKNLLRRAARHTESVAGDQAVRALPKGGLGCLQAMQPALPVRGCTLVQHHAHARPINAPTQSRIVLIDSLWPPWGEGVNKIQHGWVDW